mmetsp:Transcript_31891/g.80576  ORF Transcript_31891/g.80576 Transcript_31891/m.80576 type:complete len:571 (+) Transcript_31891:186-1898(+)
MPRGTASPNGRCLPDGEAMITLSDLLEQQEQLVDSEVLPSTGSILSSSCRSGRRTVSGAFPGVEKGWSSANTTTGAGRLVATRSTPGSAAATPGNSRHSGSSAARQMADLTRRSAGLVRTSANAQRGVELRDLNLTCIHSTLLSLLESSAHDADCVVALELWLLESQQASGPKARLQLRARWEDAAHVDTVLAGAGEEDGRAARAAAAAAFLRKQGAAVARPGQQLAGVLFTEARELSAIRFRRLQDMAEDPLLPADTRTRHCSHLFHLCGGVKVGDIGVLAVFTRRSKDGDTDSPCASATAMPYLSALGAAVASLVAMARARENCFGHRLEEARRRWRLLRYLVRSGMLALHDQELLHHGESQRIETGCLAWATHSRVAVWLRAYFSKWRGSGGKPAPPGNWTSCAWTFGGVALNLLLISGLNQLIVAASDRFFLLVGSLGALNTLMYAIPNAPLVQPRNIIGGHLLSCAVAVVWMYFTDPAFVGWVPQWVTCALAPATAIALMGKLGVTHPPAGAACLIYVSAPLGSRVGSLGWMFLLMPVLASALITLLMGMIWNNMSKRRQYPLYW